MEAIDLFGPRATPSLFSASPPADEEPHFTWKRIKEEEERVWI